MKSLRVYADTKRENCSQLHIPKAIGTKNRKSERTDNERQRLVPNVPVAAVREVDKPIVHARQKASFGQLAHTLVVAHAGPHQFRLMQDE